MLTGHTACPPPPPQLTGKVQKAFAAMDDVEANDYASLKAAILKLNDINNETHQQRLRGISKKTDESHCALAMRAAELTEVDKRARNKWKHRLPDYKTTLVSDPPFSRLPSSVVIMSISACKHKLVCHLQG